MNKPKVIMNIFSSVDGRITTAPDRNVAEWTAEGIDGEAHEMANQLYDELDCDGLISGSETLMVYGKHWVELKESLYEPKKSKAYIVFDGQGKIDWHQTEGLLVVTRENVSPYYIEQLEKKEIRYIQAGSGEHVDLTFALEKLHGMGFRNLGLSGGGSINGAFLRQGLIDEISLVMAPLAIGGKNTPTVFDCEELDSLDGVSKLDLLHMKQVGKGAVWLHYRVKK